MKAVVLERFGGPDTLALQDVPRPEPDDHEVLVRIEATSVNPVDYKIREQGDQFGIELPAIIGYDVSGTVEAVGKAVQRFEPGDDVFYTPEINARGSYAAYHVAREDIVAHKPDRLSHEEAASLPLAGCTAWQALFDRAHLQIDDTVLIHGTGGVGSLAVQMASASGARVFAVGSPYMQDRLDELGAHRAINYREENPVEVVRHETEDGTVDVVFDTVGEEMLARSLPVTAPFGRLVTILEDSSGVPGQAISNNIDVSYLMMQRSGSTMRSLQRIVERRKLEPLVADVRPLTEVAAAHEQLQEGGVSGKLVLTP